MGSLFEVVVFTASLEQYANPVLDILDPTRHARTRARARTHTHTHTNTHTNTQLLKLTL